MLIMVIRMMMIMIMRIKTICDVVNKSRIKVNVVMTVNRAVYCTK